MISVAVEVIVLEFLYSLSDTFEGMNTPTPPNLAGSENSRLSVSLNA